MPYEKKIGELIKKNNINQFKVNTGKNTESKCTDWKALSKKSKATITMYPKTDMVPECLESYQAIMKSVMKVKSAYRHANRKITS